MPQNFFISNFRYLRTQAGETQKESGSALNRVHQTIGGWEKGISEPNLDDLINISIKYGISIDNLLKVDLSDGKLIEESKKGEISKVNSKASGKVTAESVDSTIVEALKLAIAAKDEVITSKDQVIAAKTSQIEALNDSLSIAKDEISVLKRDISGLERQIAGHSGGSAQTGKRRSA